MCITVTSDSQSMQHQAVGHHNYHLLLLFFSPPCATSSAPILTPSKISLALVQKASHKSTAASFVELTRFSISLQRKKPLSSELGDFCSPVAASQMTKVLSSDPKTILSLFAEEAHLTCVSRRGLGLLIGPGPTDPLCLCFRSGTCVLTGLALPLLRDGRSHLT